MAAGFLLKKFYILDTFLNFQNYRIRLNNCLVNLNLSFDTTLKLPPNYFLKNITFANEIFNEYVSR